MPLLTDPWELLSESNRMLKELLVDNDRLADELERIARDGVPVSRLRDDKLLARCRAMIDANWVAIAESERKGEHV